MPKIDGSRQPCHRPRVACQTNRWVFDQERDAVVAIYGTVRDFRPFVKAFSLARKREADAASKTETSQGGKS